jgi:hypothetical protein
MAAEHAEAERGNATSARSMVRSFASVTSWWYGCATTGTRTPARPVGSLARATLADFVLPQIDLVERAAHAELAPPGGRAVVATVVGVAAVDHDR